MRTEEITCDVLVVGAGVSGLAAAASAAASAAAARSGAKIVLLERNSFIGGTVIAGMHRYLCGLYGRLASRTINDGIAAKLSSCLMRLSAYNRPKRLGKIYALAFRSKDLKNCLHALVKNKKNLKLILNSRVYSVKQQKGLIQQVRAKAKSGIFTIRPKVVIDASGEGAVIKLSKARYRIASHGKRQLAGFSFRLKGLKYANELLSIKVPYYIRFATYTPLDSRDECLIRLNIPAGTDAAKIRKKARNAYRYLRKTLPEFKDAYIAEFSPYITEREGLRLYGEYTLTAGDVLRGRRFKDGVVKNYWPIEVWKQKKGPYYKYINSSNYYQIPLRCLRSKNIKNLLACGRCISVTHEALGSTRVAGTCIALGEQAGIAAVKLCASY